MKKVQKFTDTRQLSVKAKHQDLSSDMILHHIDRAETIIGLHERQRNTSQRVLQDAAADIQLCDKMIESLRNDVETMNALIIARRSS